MAPADRRLTGRSMRPRGLSGPLLRLTARSSSGLIAQLAMGKKGDPPAEAVEEVASVAERLAVLMGAGVSPPDAWRHVAANRPGGVLAAAAQAARDGRNVGAAVQRGLQAGGHAPETREAWSAVSAVWSIAGECGSPLSGSLRSLAVAFRQIAEMRRELESASAGPRATVRLVAALPLIGMLFGVAMGFDTVGTLTRTGPGWLCLAIGGALMVLGARWNSRLIERARPPRGTPGIGLDLMTIALAGGCSLDRARTVVAEHQSRYGLQGAEGDGARIEEILALAMTTGAPASELLRAEAGMLRHRARVAAQTDSAVLAVKLMIPLALCFLPAFLVLGVAPVIIAVFSSTVSLL